MEEEAPATAADPASEGQESAAALSSDPLPPTALTESEGEIEEAQEEEESKPEPEPAVLRLSEPAVQLSADPLPVAPEEDPGPERS